MLLDQMTTRAWADHGPDWTRFVAALLRRRPDPARRNRRPLRLA